MVNLNASRNLPPDATPWGKAVEERLSRLEKGGLSLESATNNVAKGLNSLSNRVGGINIGAGISIGWAKNISSGGELNGDNVYNGRFADLNISIEVPDRVSSVYISGLVNIRYSGSASNSTIEIIPYVMPSGASKESVGWDDFVGDSFTNSAVFGDNVLSVPIAAYIEREASKRSADENATIGAVAHVTNANSGLLVLDSARLIGLTF